MPTPQSKGEENPYIRVIEESLRQFDEKFYGWILQDSQEIYRSFGEIKKSILSSHISLLEKVVGGISDEEVKTEIDFKENLTEAEKAVNKKLSTIASPIRECLEWARKLTK